MATEVAVYSMYFIGNSGSLYTFLSVLSTMNVLVIVNDY